MTLDTVTLAGLLQNASEAHHVYETALGHADSDWPTWYARFIADKLAGDHDHVSTASCPTCGQVTAESFQTVIYPKFPVIGKAKPEWVPLPSTTPLDAPTDEDIATYGLASYNR